MPVGCGADEETIQARAARNFIAESGVVSAVHDQVRITA